MHRIARSLAVIVVVTLSLGGALASVAAAGQAGGSKKEVLATLKVEATKVEVKKKAAESFKTAKNGQKLREGDTIRTDATGRAEVDYSDDSYTRLDVNTTFTITKLTEEEGARQVEGSLDTGRTWNRTEAVTESGSFEQSGAGATAAVVGTAFSVECTLLPNPDPTAAPEKQCSFLGVFHEIILRSENGEVRDIPEFGECVSVQPTDTSPGDLCDEVHQLTPDEIAAIDWIQENLLRDLLEHNFGPGPILTAFNVVVENGQVVAVTQLPTPPAPLAITATSSSSSSTTSTTPTTGALPPPGVGDPKVNVSGGGTNDNGDVPNTVPTGDLNEVVTEDEVSASEAVRFTVKLIANGHPLSIKFTEFPNGTFGAIQWNDGTEESPDWQPVTQIEVDNERLFPEATQFRFVPQEKHEPYECYGETDCLDSYPAGATLNHADGTVEWTTSFKVVVVDTSTNLESPEASIPIKIIDNICSETPDSGLGYELGCFYPTEIQATVTTQAPPDTSPPTTADTTPETSADTSPATEPTTTPTTEETTTTTEADAG